MQRKIYRWLALVWWTIVIICPQKVLPHGQLGYELAVIYGSALKLLIEHLLNVTSINKDGNSVYGHL